MVTKKLTIAFQGVLGAYSHQACTETYPDAEVLPCKTFEGVIAAVDNEEADLAMLPVENSTYGRVADIHHLLPESNLNIIAEHFLPVHISLMGLPGTKVADITTAMSHPVLLGQCRAFLNEHDIHRRVGPDTAGSAEIVSKQEDRSLGALAADLAADIYGLDVLANHVEDYANNTTRFLVMSREPLQERKDDVQYITSFVFQVRNIPAALYKALGGFATNGVNMVKLESYMLNGSFTATQFYADIFGAPEDPAVQRAMEELDYFTESVKRLGVYEAHKARLA